MLSVVAFLSGVLLGAGAIYVILLNKQAAIKQEQQRLRNESTRLDTMAATLRSRQQELAAVETQTKIELLKLETRKIKYTELEDENRILKRDLQNIDVDLGKLQMDRELQKQHQDEIDQRIQEIGVRYLKENVKWIGSSINANNYAACKDRLLAVIMRCRGINFDVTKNQEQELLAGLKAEYEKSVRAAFQREEQARIKAHIREEEALKREIERELKQLDREKAAIRTALDKALAEAKDRHSEEVERLKARLAEAEAKSQRTQAQAELTKAGHVYVISNIGSFGENVFKIGMTRRFEPNDRVRELGDASVPFPFDVHMMISSDDAPKLENELHKALHKSRLNKINPRKEFFKSQIEEIRQIVEANHGKVDYIAVPEALEYRQSISMSDEDSDYIERLYDEMEEQDQAIDDNDPK